MEAEQQQEPQISPEEFVAYVTQSENLAAELPDGRLAEIAGKEGVAVSDSGLRMIARAGEGSMRDAQSLLDQVKTDEDAKQAFLDLLELMGPTDPRTAEYRKKLTAQLF